MVKQILPHCPAFFFHPACGGTGEVCADLPEGGLYCAISLGEGGFLALLTYNIPLHFKHSLRCKSEGGVFLELRVIFKIFTGFCECGGCVKAPSGRELARSD